MVINQIDNEYYRNTWFTMKTYKYITLAWKKRLLHELIDFLFNISFITYIIFLNNIIYSLFTYKNSQIKTILGQQQY